VDLDRGRVSVVDGYAASAISSRAWEKGNPARGGMEAEECVDAWAFTALSGTKCMYSYSYKYLTWCQWHEGDLMGLDGRDKPGWSW
jgi:hypothetical protein